MFTSKPLLLKTRNAVMILMKMLTQFGLVMLSGVILNARQTVLTSIIKLVSSRVCAVHFTKLLAARLEMQHGAPDSRATQFLRYTC